MRITPKTEEELSLLWSDGVYPFKIDNAEEGISKSSGNPQITLSVEVFKPDGKSIFVKDYIGTANVFMERKLRHAALACGLDAEYNAGTLHDYDFKGKEGFLNLGIQADKTGKYGDKNVVKDYIVSGAPSKAAPAVKPKAVVKEAPKDDPFADEIPF
jgi:hypothetical protein